MTFNLLIKPFAQAPGMFRVQGLWSLPAFLTIIPTGHRGSCGEEVVLDLEPEYLGSRPSPGTNQLCDLTQGTSPLFILFSSKNVRVHLFKPSRYEKKKRTCQVSEGAHGKPQRCEEGTIAQWAGRGLTWVS